MGLPHPHPSGGGDVKLRPFFGYYGSKWAMARLYPAPQHRTIIEPFAGAAFGLFCVIRLALGAH